jgi:hypothetical protein
MKNDDTKMLNWLIRNGYTPSKNRPWQPSDGRSHPGYQTGRVFIALGGRREIRKAMEIRK